MAEITDLDAEARNQNVILAKLLLRKFNILHEFHAQQLERFTIACCNSSISGDVTVDGDARTVEYNLKTLRYFKKEGKKTVARHRLSPIGYLNFPPKKYEEEKKLALKNLMGWTKELLWDDTRVKVIIDGQPVE